MKNFPNRDMVRPGGVYDPSLEPLWDAALDAYYAEMPSHPNIHAAPMPDGVEAVEYKGACYLQGWDPDVHPAREFLESEAVRIHGERLAARAAEGEARAARLAQLEQAKDGIDKASTVAGVRTAAAAAIAALEARLAALEGR